MESKELNSKENAKRDDLKVADQNSDKIIRETLQNEGKEVQCSKDIYIQKDVSYFTAVEETKLHKSEDYEQTSDTSALMKLAEIACNTTDNQVNSEEELSQEPKAGGTHDIINLQYPVEERPIQEDSPFLEAERSPDDTTSLHPLAEIPNMTESKSEENFENVPLLPKGKTSDIEKLGDVDKSLDHTALSLMTGKSVDLIQNLEENDKLNLSNIDSNISSLIAESFSSDSLQKLSTVDSLKNKPGSVKDKNEKNLELCNIDDFSSFSEIISNKNEDNSDIKIKSNIGDEIDKVFTQERKSAKKSSTKSNSTKENQNISHFIHEVSLSTQHSSGAIQRNPETVDAFLKESFERSPSSSDQAAASATVTGLSYCPENFKEKHDISEKEQSVLSQECCTASSLPQEKLIASSKDDAYSDPSLFSPPKTNLIDQDASSSPHVPKDLNDRTKNLNFISEISNCSVDDESFDQSLIRIESVETSKISTIEKYKENKAMDKDLKSENKGVDNIQSNLNSLTYESNNDNIHSDICSTGMVKENDTKLKLQSDSSKLNLQNSDKLNSQPSITQKVLDIQNSNVIEEKDGCTNISNTQQDNSSQNLPKYNTEVPIQIADKVNDIHNKSNLTVETFGTSLQGTKITPVAQDSFTKSELTKPTSNINGNNKTDAHSDLKTSEASETDAHINLMSEATNPDAHIELIMSEAKETDTRINLTSEATKTDAHINLTTDEVSQRNPIVEAIIQPLSKETSNKTSTENRYQNISTDNSEMRLDRTTENVERERLNEDSSSSDETLKQIENNINEVLCSQNKLFSEKSDSDGSFISKDYTGVSKENSSSSKLNIDVLCEIESSQKCEKDEHQTSAGLSHVKMEILDEIDTNLAVNNKNDESIEKSLPRSYIENTIFTSEKEKNDYSHSVVNATKKMSDSSNAPSQIQETVSKEICDDHNNIEEMSCQELLRSNTNLKHSLKIDLKESQIFSDNEDEESPKKIGQPNASHSQIQSGKIFVRKDLTENIDSDNDQQIPLSSSDICTSTSINDKDELSNKSRKRLLSGSSQDLPLSKRMTYNKESKSEVTDEENLIIDEDCKLPSTQKKSKQKRANKAFHHIYSKEEESMIAIVASTEEICAKCKELWNHNTLKMLFEGNESVTINSRITYGAIICMNIFVGIHYPSFKEEALRGLLERADLTKNLGSIKVSILNSWLLALIKNKKINCCSPFRPIYRIKTRSLHLSDKNGKDSALECKLNEEKVQNLEESEENISTESSSGNKKTRAEEQSKSVSCHVPELFSDGSNEDSIKKKSYDDLCKKTTLHHSSFISSSSDSNEGSNQENSYTFTKIPVAGKGNKSSVRNVTTKHNPTLHTIVLMEKDSLDPNLHPLYDNLVCESKITEAEARYGKRKYISNKEVLSIHSVCILNSKKLNLKNYFTLFLQILHHREYSIFIPDHKTLVKHVENLRREDNRHKYSLSKTKQFRQSPWDNESLYSASFSSLKSTDSWPTIREILTIFCLWKNRKLLPKSNTEMDLAKEVSTLFQNKFEIKDCLGLCIRLYTIYCRLMFDEGLSDVGKAKMFLNLHYLPKKEQDLQKDKIALNFSASFLLQTQNDLPNIISYLEEQALDAPKTVRQTLPEIIIDCKLEQTKKLKTELLRNINDPLVTNLFDTYGKLKNELNFLEEEKTLARVRSNLLVHTEQTVSYSPQMKLMMAKLRVGNVPTEVIPSVMEKVFKNLLKRKVPSGSSSSPY